MSLPPPLAALLDLGGLTAAELELLATRHRVADVLGLERACRTNRVRDDAAFGPERQAEIRKALRITPVPRPRLPLAEARGVASRILASLQNHESAVRLAAVGGIRRMESYVDRVELIASAHEIDALLDKMAGLGPVHEVLERTERSVVVRTEDGATVSLDVFPEDPGPYLSAFVRRTGPEAHAAALAERATARSLTLDERGLLDANGPMPLAWEPDIYTALELPVIPAELRHRGVEAPPADLVSMRDVKGLAHVHTSHGAGVPGVEGYARTAVQNGFAWVLITDRGLTVDAVAAQRADAEAVHADEDLPIRVLIGAEARVAADGSLDLPDAVLDAVDVVIAAVEDAPGEAPSELDPTPRYLAAAGHPRVHVLAHPRAMEGMGPGRAPDWDALLPALAASGTALEVSGASARLALEAVLPGAAAAGVRLLASAEAHDFGEVDREIVAVGTLRRAARPVSEVLSTLSAEELLAWASR